MDADNDRVAWDFSFPSIDGGTLNLADFKGQVVLVANTASFCGYTRQYADLQKVYAAKSSAGLVVIGVPSQDFRQESDDNATVKAFCESRFHISFPLAGISHVRGAQAAPFFAWVNAQTQWQPKWNFSKVLIGRNGRVAGTFGSVDGPDGVVLSRAIDAELARAV